MRSLSLRRLTDSLVSRFGGTPSGRTLPVRSGPLLCALGLPALVLLGCERDEEPERTTFYQRRIEPILSNSCSSSPSQSSCHVTADEFGNALGNLSVESYEALNRRRDLLTDYGPYGVPGLLLKALQPYSIRITSWDGSEPQIINTNIAHVGGSSLDLTSSAFTQLETWIRGGAAENNAPAAVSSTERTPCTEALGSDPLFDPSQNPPGDDYEQFEAAGRVIATTCAAGNCHGSAANSLHFTCGSDDEQKRWNYFAASDYVSVDTDSSELLRRTLPSSFGGSFHEGGVIFDSTGNSDYRALRDWAEAKGGPSNVPDDEGFPFFTSRVQPMLVKRGCMMLGCHSPTMFHDYRLRGGSAGHFGLAATRRNYELTLEQVALETSDPNASRLIKKNLSSPNGGIAHRGGPLLGNGGDPSACDLEAAETGPIDEQDPYCVLVAWIARERAARMADAVPFESIVFVRRDVATDADVPQDFGTFRPGADVVQASVTVAADGALTLGAETSLSAACGLDPATSDARRAAVSWDGTRIAFSGRASESEPYRIYVVERDGSCAVEPTIDAAAMDDEGNAVPDNGELVHNFDPTFAADGRIVFTSTRGNVMNTTAFSYQGPQRTPADPSRLNANLYVLEGEPDALRVRQLTFLLDQEIAPSFMSDGRLIFTAEKRAPGFYQLAGRRINLDGGDYHPLFAQRSSVDFNQLTDIVELSDKNLAGIFSDKGAQHGAGTLVVINRSVGIDQRSENPDDYAQNPDAIDRINPEFFQRSVRIVDQGATGKPGETLGAYRSPSPLPDGRLLVSYAPNVTDVGNFSGGFAIYTVNPETGERTPLLTDASRDLLWPVAVYARQPRTVFPSRFDEANGATRVTPGRGYAEVLYLDAPLMLSLVFQNTRTGRELGPAAPLDLFELLPPEAGTTSFGDAGEGVEEDQFGQLYVRRRSLGTVPLQSDGSAKALLPGGVPFTYRAMVRLDGDSEPTEHFVREQFQFYPGESLRQSFPRGLFNGLCGGCHGSVSGLEYDVAANPDVLTQASAVQAADGSATDLR
jgi:hypothetical protein